MSNWLIVVVLIFVVTACSQDNNSGALDGTGLVIYTPDFLLESRAINAENFAPTLTIDNRTYSLTKSANQWTGTFQVEANDSYQLIVDWFETYKGRRLQVASASKSITVDGAAVSAEIAAADYDIDRFDDDGDGQSNLDERNNDSNPFVHKDIESTALVTIPRLPGDASTPTIDGVYNAEEWVYATATDKAGSQLFIDSLLFVQAAGADVSAQVNRWQAVHDGDYLYLLIFSNDQIRTSDSSDAWNDDDLNIFLDADYSHLRGYDGVNDFHMMIPLLKRNLNVENISGTSNARIQQGSNSTTLPRDIKFATGISAGPIGNRGTKMDVYELRISLAQTSIVVGKLFGMDVQLDDDDDGGLRDSKWSWYLRSGDLSHLYTDEFAAIVLEQ